MFFNPTLCLLRNPKQATQVNSNVQGAWSRFMTHEAKGQSQYRNNFFKKKNLRMLLKNIDVEEKSYCIS